MCGTKQKCGELGNLGLLFFELGAEIAPFVREAVQVVSPLFAFVVEGIPAGVVLISGRVGEFHVSSFDLFFELTDFFFQGGNLLFQAGDAF